VINNVKNVDKMCDVFYLGKASDIDLMAFLLLFLLIDRKRPPSKALRRALRREIK
jgi:hypothetical protein